MLKFEFATEKDLPRIVEIYNQTIPTRLATADLEPVSVESRRPWFFEHNPECRPLWILTEASEIIGWVSLEEFYGRPAYSRTAEISIYIDKNHQKAGLGQQTLDFVQHKLENLGIDTLVAFIFGHNVASQKLFKKNGFETWGHLPEVALMDNHLRDLDILGRRFLGQNSH